MKKQATFYGTVTAGKVKFQCPSLLSRFVETFPDGTAIQVVVSKQYDSVSRNQMGYYYGVIIPYAQEYTGYLTPQETDKFLKAMFLVEHMGTEFEQLKSKQDLDVVEMGEFLEKCIAFLGSEGVVVPQADSHWKVVNDNSIGKETE